MIELSPLIPPPVPAQLGPEPLHKVQYVIEIVGPRSLEGNSVKALLDPKWQGPLGDPRVFVMGPADARWRELSADDPTGSYDSLALTWNLLKHHGALGIASARHLLTVAQSYADQVQRRALPLPVPDDVDTMKDTLESIRDSLDIGVELVVVFPGAGVAEGELVATLAARGLAPVTEGYAWLVPGWDPPLFHVTACEDEPVFPSGDATYLHQALSMGFSIPRNPAPDATLEAMLSLAGDFSARFGAHALADGAPADAAALRPLLAQALQAFEQANLKPGSPEALVLFGAT